MSNIETNSQGPSVGRTWLSHHNQCILSWPVCILVWQTLAIINKINIPQQKNASVLQNTFVHGSMVATTIGMNETWWSPPPQLGLNLSRMKLHYISNKTTTNMSLKFLYCTNMNMSHINITTQKSRLLVFLLFLLLCFFCRIHRILPFPFCQFSKRHHCVMDSVVHFYLYFPSSAIHQ